jgi:poly(A) polymerase
MDSVAVEIVRRLQQEGHTTYFAGGCVRDMLLGSQPHDFDIATSAHGDEIAALFPKCVMVGAAFGVVQVVEDGRGFEVASFRKEMGYSDGRHPDRVERGTPEEDAARRDFTINGMFYDPVEKKVIDFVGGQADLEKHQLRAIGNPIERMQEDRLRCLRAVRFACRLNFELDSGTAGAIESVAPLVTSSVSAERIRDEMQKMAEHPSFESALFQLHKLGLFKALFPECSADHRLFKACGSLPLDLPLELKLVGLLTSTAIEDRLTFFERYKFSKKALGRINTYTYLESLDFEIAPDHKLARAFARMDSDLALVALMAYSCPDGQTQHIYAARARLEYHINQLKKRSPPVRAADLVKHGIEPGPLLGTLLELAQNMAIDSDLREVNEIIDQLKLDSIWPAND